VGGAGEMSETAQQGMGPAVSLACLPPSWAQECSDMYAEAQGLGDPGGDLQGHQGPWGQRQGLLLLPPCGLLDTLPPCLDLE
jgi:hypothetical protein